MFRSNLCLTSVRDNHTAPRETCREPPFPSSPISVFVLNVSAAFAAATASRRAAQSREINLHRAYAINLTAHAYILGDRDQKGDFFLRYRLCKKTFSPCSLSFAAVVAIGRHGPDVEAPGGTEDPERRCRRDGGGRRADDDDDVHAGARGMHKTATGDFRRSDRFSRGRRAGGQPAGEDTVRLSVFAWLRRGQKLRHRVLQFGLGVPGAFYSAGARRGAGPRVPQGRSREASRLTESARDPNQIGPVAGTSGGLSRSLPTQGRRVDLLRHARALSCNTLRSNSKITVPGVVCILRKSYFLHTGLLSILTIQLILIMKFNEKRYLFI